MNHKKLVRGIIYDNPNVVEEELFQTALSLDVVTDVAGEFYDKTLTECKCPTKEEFIVSAVIDAICYPYPDEVNLIIPSCLVDDRLYRDLKKIDIGEELCRTYIDIREDKFIERCEEEGIEPHPLFDTEEEKIDHIMKTSGINPTSGRAKVILSRVS